jgi:excisionase family DNA binding protein
MTESNQWLTVSEAAARTGECDATIRSRFDAGELTGQRDGHGRRLIDPASITAPTDLSLSEAARRLGRSSETVRRWFDEGLLSGHRDRAGRRRISAASVTARKRKLARP